MFQAGQRVFQAGLRANQDAIAEIEGESGAIRNFESVLSQAGLLQTPQDARYRLAENLEGRLTVLAEFG
ncbi:MAG: hypothetical protein ACRDND_03010 [Streptosporangiaceae bacterium]